MHENLSVWRSFCQSWLKDWRLSRRLLALLKYCWWNWSQVKHLNKRRWTYLISPPCEGSIDCKSVRYPLGSTTVCPLTESDTYNIQITYKQEHHVANINTHTFISWKWGITQWLLTHYFTWLFIGRLLHNQQASNFTNLENWKNYIDKELKVLQ